MIEKRKRHYRLKLNRSSGFTLIELLIVVAIIAILAAIAVPNFLEAQTRSKVARAKADIRSVATALEAYHTDNNHYPIDITAADGFTPGTTYYWYVANSITTPISYITTINFIDPFRIRGTERPLNRRYRYVNYEMGEFNAANLGQLPESYQVGENIYGRWRLSSSGPDYVAGPWDPLSSWPDGSRSFPRELMNYDPTNGTVSLGDIVRSQKSSEPTQTTMAP